MNEIELFEKFKNKLIDEYGYDEKDIVFEPRDMLPNNKQNYIPDIVVYKDNKPYIVIELKMQYSYRIFEKAFEQVSKIAKFLDVKYFTIATLDFIESYELSNNNVITIPNIPEKNNKVIVKKDLSLSTDQLLHLFIEIKDILWAGGKRDEYTIINEFNKILLTKIFHEKQNEHLLYFYKKQPEFKLYQNSETSDTLNVLFKVSNKEFKLFDESESLNINQKELERIVNLIEKIELSKVEDIEKIYFTVFINSLTDQILLSDDYSNIFHDSIDTKFKNILITNSGFGQISLSLRNELKISSIENNQIRYQTNSILKKIKGLKQKNYLGDFLSNDIINEQKYQIIIALPPLNLKTKQYPQYTISGHKATKDTSLLYIEKSLELLEDDGLLYIIVSDSILSNTSFTKERDFIKRNYQIMSIISVPNNFLNNIKVQSSLLVLRKRMIKDYKLLMVQLNGDKDYIKYIVNNEINDNYLNINTLKNRWDYHYNKQEYLELENKIKVLDTKNLSDYVETIRGGSLGDNKLGTIDLITVSTITNGELQKDKLSKITEEQNSKNKRSIVQENDLVISVNGNYPRCAKVTIDFVGSNTNSGIVILRAKNDYENKIDIIYKYFNSPLGQLLLHRGISLTSTTSILTQYELEKIPIVESDDEDISVFINQVKEIPIFSNNNYGENNGNKDSLINENTIVSLSGIRGDVFGMDVVRSFISLKDLTNFSTNNQDFQREINDEHKDKLVKFLEKSDYKFFPEIVVALKNFDMLIDKGLISIPKKNSYGFLNFNEFDNFNKNIFDYIEILDGRHRIESLKNYLDKNKSNENITVSIVFILLSDSDSDNLVNRAIFYNLNAKAKPLLPNDYLHFLENDEEDKLKNLEIIDIDLFKHITFHKKRLFSLSKNKNEVILEKCINIVHHLRANFESIKLKRLDFLIEIFQKLNNEVLKEYSIHLKTKFYILMIDIIKEKKFNRKTIKKYFIKELIGFIEWLELSNLMDSIHNVVDLKDFYRTYQKTFVPKSRKIYLSMPYHKETEWTYFLIKDIVNEISKNLKITIELIRTDEQINGVHAGVSETVYDEIASCDLMIADLTGDNVNVFNEVGFKMGLDKAEGIKQTQVIFIVNSKCYYEEFLKYEKSADNTYKVDGKLVQNKSKQVPFNLRGIKHIKFHESHYLKAELYKELEQYFSYYKITKVSK